MRRSLTVIICTLTVLVGAANTRAQEASTLVVNVTSDDVWAQQMAFQFARSFMEATDGELVVFLNVRAVGAANTEVPQHTTAATGKTPQELIAALLADGARVFLCGGCTEQAGLSPDDRIDGVEVAGRELLEVMAAPGTSVISY